MIKAILLAAAIFWYPNFVLGTQHTFNFIKKFGLKKNFKNDLVKKQIKQIQKNRIIARLDKLFANNLNWWHFIIIVFSPLTLKNQKK